MFQELDISYREFTGQQVLKAGLHLLCFVGPGHRGWTRLTSFTAEIGIPNGQIPLDDVYHLVAGHTDDQLISVEGPCRQQGALKNQTENWINQQRHQDQRDQSLAITKDCCRHNRDQRPPRRIVSVGGESSFKVSPEAIESELHIVARLLETAGR